MPVIAIDGPGGAGKSSVAAELATRLGVARLDTGAMYRAVTLLALRRGIPTSDGPRLGELARELDLEVAGRVTVDGEDVTEAIRAPGVDAAVSAVSAHAAVRRALVARQRAWVAARRSGVVEGRDIGTVVLPDAPVKVFLTAAPGERARRRALDQATDTGSVDLAAVAAAIATRDELDSTREVSPLVPAADAVVIDSTGRSIASIVDEIAALVGPDPEPAGGAGSRPVRPISWRVRWFYAVCRAIAVGAGRLFMHGPTVGAEHLPRSGPYLLAPLHRSDIDFLIVARITRRRLRFIAKSGIFVNRPFNWLIETLGAFPVNRQATDREAFNRALEVLVAGEPLVIFPEGTRNAGPTIGPTREGAAYLALRAGVPLVPVGLAGTDRTLPRGKRLPRPSRVACVVGEPIMTGVEHHATDGRTRVPRSAVHALTEELREAIQALSDEAASIVARR
ncbi:MAG: (d)CMP kinase [Acidimicrobiales bacterium]